MSLKSLPPELLLKVVGYLDRKDTISLHSTCGQLHEVLDESVYSQIRAQWSRLTELVNDHTRILHFTKTITVHETNSTGEWRYGKQLPSVLAAAQHFDTLIVDCKGSSSAWLKYVGPLTITALELRAVGENALYLFDFDDILTNFPVLKSLKLTGFQLLPASSPLTHLQSLSLTNCTWEYPMNLADVGDLRALSVAVRGYCNPFAYSERLIHDTTFLPPNLEYFRLHLDISRSVNWRPLKQGATKLKELELAGFYDFTIDKSHVPVLREIHATCRVDIL